MPLPNYNATDPCFCFGKCSPNKPDPTCKNGECFELGTIVVSCDNSVGPCGETAIIPFTCFCYPCDNPVFKITNLNEIQGLTIDNIDKEGITVTTTGELDPNDKVEICFKASCPSEESCNHKSDYGSVVIYIKDKCSGVECNEGFECEKCNGDCVALTPELSLTNSNNEIGLS